MISLKNITLQFDKDLFQDCSLDIQNGLWTTFDGESGCGKTTLFKMILGVIEPTQGEILYDGKVLSSKQKNQYIFEHIAYVDQIGSFYPNMSIKDHFEFYAELYQMDNNQILDCLKQVGLEDIDIHQPMTVLSTGERKRILIALALFSPKDIIMIDEPTASLDIDSTKIILSLLKECVIQRKKTIICATHDLQVIKMSDQVYTIKHQKITLISHFQQGYSQIEKKIKLKLKINYFKYKNLHQKVLFIILIILQSLCLLGSSLILATYFGYSIQSQQEFESSNNTGLILTKLLDEREDEFEFYEENIDFLDQQEIAEIKKIDGVQHIDKYYCLYLTLGSQQIKLLKDKTLEKTIENKYTSPENNAEINADFYIVGYYPYQNIQHQGKNIVGTYIDETFRSILKEDIAGKKIVLNGAIPSTMKLVKEDKEIVEEGKTVIYHNVPIYHADLSETKEFSFQITDYIQSDEYSVAPQSGHPKTEQEICIYMPVDKIQQLLRDNASKNNLFQVRKYIITCDPDKKQDVRIAVEKLNPLYQIQDQGLYSYEIHDFDMNQISQQAIITMVIVIILLLSVLVFHIYQIMSRKKEVTKLRYDGLSSSIYSFFIKDAKRCFFSTLIISLATLFIINIYYSQAFSSISFIVIWLIVTIVMNIALYGMDVIMIRRIQRIEKND